MNSVKAVNNEKRDVTDFSKLALGKYIFYTSLTMKFEDMRNKYDTTKIDDL